MQLLDLLKKIPIDLGQGNLREKTKGKLIAKSLVPEPEQGDKALDVGCREGIQTRWLRDKGYEVVPMDIDPEIDDAVVADANKDMPFEDDSFDLIWCSEVIEHLENPAKSIQEFKRILKPGGEMILTTPNSAFWIYPVLNLFGLTPEKVQNPTHTHFFNIDDIRKLFPEADIYGFFPYLWLKFRIKMLVGLLSPTFVIHAKLR